MVMCSFSFPRSWNRKVFPPSPCFPPSFSLSLFCSMKQRWKCVKRRKRKQSWREDDEDGHDGHHAPPKTDALLRHLPSPPSTSPRPPSSQVSWYLGTWKCLFTRGTCTRVGSPWRCWSPAARRAWCWPRDCDGCPYAPRTAGETKPGINVHVVPAEVAHVVAY